MPFPIRKSTAIFMICNIRVPKKKSYPLTVMNSAFIVIFVSFFVTLKSEVDRFLLNYNYKINLLKKSVVGNEN